MNPWLPPLLVWAAAALAMTFGWLVQRRTRNAGIVDAVWAVCMSASAMFYAGVGDGAAIARLGVAMLGGIWAFRLCLDLWHRVRTEPEDGRYRHLRAHWKGSQGKFFLFFQAQALLVLLFALPFAAVAANPVKTADVWTAIGVALWLLSVALESVADWQLAAFRADPAHRGKTCREGWWRYSRHPNYFFEWLHWFSYVALAVGSPIGWLAWSGPLVMYVFLRWISGVPYTEAQALRTRGEEYRAYQQTTPMLFPWFPRTDTSRSSP